MSLSERFYESDRLRHVVRVVRTDAMQIIEQLVRDKQRRGVLHAVDHSVPYCPNRSEVELFLHPIDQETRRRALIGGFHAAAARFIPNRVVESQTGTALTYAVDLAREQSLQRSVRRIECEFDA